MMMRGTIFSHAKIHKQDETKKGQYDDRIIEAHWDLDQQAWRFMRIRDDKPGAEYYQHDYRTSSSGGCTCATSLAVPLLCRAPANRTLTQYYGL